MKFEIENCKFSLKQSQTKETSTKNYQKQAQIKSLGSLKACTKYDVSLTIVNLATKKEFSYQNVVHTKVDFNVAKIALKVDTLAVASANLSWNLTGSDTCVTGYKLEVNDGEEISTISVKDKKTAVTNLSACKVYTAKVTAETARDEKITSPEISFTLKQNSQNQKVENIQLNIEEVTENSASISWSSDSSDCLQKYRLKLRDSDDKIVYEKNVFTNSTVIADLTSCNNYSVELIALNSADLSLIATIKSFITLSAPIENVNISVKHSTATISWPKPDKLDCLSSYFVSYVILDCEEPKVNCSASKIIDKTKASVELAALPLAHRFSLKFYANLVTSSGEDARQAKTLQFDTIDYDKFLVQNINEFRLKRMELQLQWGVEHYLKKNVKHYEVFFDDKVLTTENPFITLSIAACKMNYTVTIRCISVDGYKGTNVTYNTSLHDDDVPLSSLKNQIQYKQINDSVIISWTPIKEEESCIAFYEIIFNDQTFKSYETRTEINDFAPCITYELDITPVSHHGNAGRTSIFEFTSLEFCEFI